MFEFVKTFFLVIKGQGPSWSVYVSLIVGTAVSVVVFCWLLALREGFLSASQSTGRPDQIVLLSHGARNEAESFVDFEQVTVATRLPAIQRDDNGLPMASPELMALAEVSDADGVALSVMVRGVFENTDALRSHWQLVEGTPPVPGKREVMLGHRLAKLLRRVAVGDDINIRGTPWKVTGIFVSGDAYESEIWTDAPTLANALSMRGVQSVRIRLGQNFDRQDVIDSIDANTKLTLTAWLEPQFFARNTTQLSGAMLGVAVIIGSIMALAGGIAAFNGMTFLAARRSYVFGLLRSFGFKSRNIVIALLIEGTLIALLGIILGASSAYILVDDVTANVFNVQTYSQLVFEYELRGQHVLIAMVGGVDRDLAWLGRAFGAFCHRPSAAATPSQRCVMHCLRSRARAKLENNRGDEHRRSLHRRVLLGQIEPQPFV